jgi:hypothetical protein
MTHFEPGFSGLATMASSARIHGVMMNRIIAAEDLD